MTTNDGFVSRQECLVRLRALLGEDRTLAPGMSGPRGLPYGGFSLKGVGQPALASELPGQVFLWLEWHGQEVLAKLVDDAGAYREPTELELQTVLRTFEKHAVEYASNPDAWHARNLPRRESPLSTLCQEIVLRPYQVH